MPTMTAGRDLAFRRLLRASSVSMLGSQVTSIAYPLLVLRLTSSPVEAGWVAFAAITPSLLVHVPAGALVDRWDARRAMLVSEIGRGMAIAAVAVMVVMSKPNVPLLTMAAVVEGILGVFSTLAERRCVGSIVRPEQVPSALARLEGRTHVVVLVGRPLGGLLFGLEPILPFLADVVTFIYSVAALARVKSRWPAAGGAEAGREPTRGSRLSGDIRTGVSRIFADRFARTVIITFSAGTLIFQALIMAFLADAHARKLSALAIGIVLAASGVGGALGSAAASWLRSRVRYPWIKLQTLIWFLGFAVLALVTRPQVILMATIMGVLGFTGAMGNIELNTYLMRKFEKDMLGRVTSVSRLMSQIACGIGPAFGGIIVQGLGIHGAMTFLFLVTSALPLLAVAARKPAVGPDQSEALDPVGKPLTYLHDRWAARRSGLRRVVRSRPGFRPGAGLAGRRPAAQSGRDVEVPLLREPA